jgi:predicted ATP-dependent serine protease
LAKAAVEPVTPAKKKTARRSASGTEYLRITRIIAIIINRKLSLKPIYKVMVATPY